MSRLPSQEFILLMLENESKGKKKRKYKEIHEIQRACVCVVEDIFISQFSTFSLIIQLG